ncbi:MAG: AEC family transporter [Chloroflexota bacterium]
MLDFLKLSAEKIFKNPIIIAIFLGLLFNLLRLPISEYLFNTLVLLRSAALPTALFMMGGSLANYRLGGQMSRAFTIVALKMFIAPTLVYLLVTFVFDVPDLWAAVAVVTAALPVGINSAVFANKYDSAVAPVGSAVLLSTFLSIGTISFLLSIYA